MDIWTILGIEQTTDEDAINAAYRDKLQLVHPEDHPEEFMQLRGAYDEAIRLARQAAKEESAEKTPVDMWIDRVREVYDCLPRRLNPDEWKALLADEVCQGLDSRLDARDAFLAFGMECFYLPPEIWQLLEDSFSFRENREELYEKFPKDYIDNAVIDGTEGQPTVPYELFAEGTNGNPDSYIRLYFKARNERREGNLDACAATIEDMKKSGFKHPYTELSEAELMLRREDEAASRAIADRLAESYPGDISIRLFHGELARRANEVETALADYEVVLERFSKHNQAAWGKAECLLALDKLEEAKDEYLGLHQRLPFDEDISNRINEVNQRLVERYERMLEETPDNFEMRMDYAWSCLQRQEHDKAKALLAEAHPESLAQQADLENISTKLYLNCEEPETALEHALAWEKIVPQLPEGETDIEKRRKGKMAEILYLQAMALSMMERYDEAIEKANASQAVNPKKTDAYEVRRRIYSIRREFDKAVAESEKIVELEPNYSHWFVLAVDQYNLGSKAAAYHSLGEALNYGRVLQAYIWRARILCDVDEWDGVKQTIEYLEENGVSPEQDVMRYLKARVLHQEGEKDEALKIYNSLIENYEAGESPVDFAFEIYHKAADIEDDNGRDPEEVLTLVEKGLKDKDDFLPLLDLKSYLLWKQKKYDEHMAVNERILELYPRHSIANERIGDILYDEHNEYEKALEYYHRQEKLRDSAVLQEVMALCFMYLEQPEKSEAHYLRAVEMEPERLRPRSNLGLLYERIGQHEKSVPLQEECVRINIENKKGDKRPYRWLARALARMRRYEEAMEAYRKNLELYGEDEDARHIVEVCMESGDFTRSDKLLEKYHAEGKITEPYLRMKIDIVRLQKKPYLKLIKKLEDGTEKTRRLADYYYSKKKYDKSLEYYRKLDEIDPELADRQTPYIGCLRELGMTEEWKAMSERCLKDSEKMAKNGWRRAMYLTHKAFVLLAARRLEEAKEYIDRSFTAPMCDHCRYSKCKDAYSALAEYYEITGEYQKALDLYREVLEIAPDEFDAPEYIEKLKKEHKLK